MLHCGMTDSSVRYSMPQVVHRWSSASAAVRTVQSRPSWAASVAFRGTLVVLLRTVCRASYLASEPFLWPDPRVNERAHFVRLKTAQSVNTGPHECKGEGTEARGAYRRMRALTDERRTLVVSPVYRIGSLPLVYNSVCGVPLTPILLQKIRASCQSPPYQ